MYTYICMCIYTHISIHVYIYTYVCIYIYIHRYVHIRATDVTHSHIDSCLTCHAQSSRVISSRVIRTVEACVARMTRLDSSHDLYDTTRVESCHTCHARVMSDVPHTTQIALRICQRISVSVNHGAYEIAMSHMKTSCHVPWCK